MCARLSRPARALLLELARQFVRDNNGRLLASAAYLSARGWRGADVITRAKRELLKAGFIHETVKGHRPNKASWYAITWQTLDRLPGYDSGAAETFRRGAYRLFEPLKNATLKPSHGIESPFIAPSSGVGKPWLQATGPRTPDGKDKAARNAYKGGHWLKLRELTKMVNAEIRQARELVDSCQT